MEACSYADSSHSNSGKSKMKYAYMPYILRKVRVIKLLDRIQYRTRPRYNHDKAVCQISFQ